MYSRKFTTSVVLGNDLVPRISFRSLLYLKQSLKHLLQDCEKPKFNVLFLPKWCSGGGATPGRSLSTTCLLPEGFESLIVGEHTTGESLQNAVFPPTHIRLPNSTPAANVSSSRQVSMDLLDNPDVFEREITGHVKNMCGQFMPTFPPGKIFHLKVNKSASPCCLGYFYPNQLEMEKVRNEDLCVIIIDRGAVDDHLPNHVLAALQRFKRQALAQSYREAEVERLREEAWREMDQKRKARALSSAREGWVFPTTAVGRDPNTSTTSTSYVPQSSSSTVYSTPDADSHWSRQPTDAPDTAAGLPAMDETNLEDAPTAGKTSPTNLDVDSLDHVNGTNGLPMILEEDTHTSDTTSRCREVEEVLDTRVVHVEVHKDERHLVSDCVEQHESEAGPDHSSCSSPDTGEAAIQAITTVTHRPRQFEMIPLKPTATQQPPSLKSEEPVFPPSQLVAGASRPGNPPSVIPVRVPFPPTTPPSASPALPPSAVPLSPHGRHQGRGRSARPSNRRSLSDRVLRRLSRGHLGLAGERVVTVQPRRGCKLKIIIPTSADSSVM